MSVEWPSTKHIILVQSFQFDWLPWQPKGYIFAKNIKKINSSEAVRWIKLKLCRIVHDISVLKLVFYCRCLSTLVAMATLNFHRLIMGNVQNGINCYFIADILTKVFQKCLLSGPLSNIYVFVKISPFDWLSWQPKD